MKYWAVILFFKLIYYAFYLYYNKKLIKGTAGNVSAEKMFICFIFTANIFQALPYITF